MANRIDFIRKERIPDHVCPIELAGPVPGEKLWDTG